MYDVLHDELRRARIRERSRQADRLRWQAEVLAARRTRRRGQLTALRARLTRLE